MEYVEGTSYPVHFIFQNTDYQDNTDNKNLLDVYFWKPDKIGGSSEFKVTNRDTVSEERKRKYKEPNTTERSGLVTSRVGQGYYRQQIIEKWESKCPVTKSELLQVLISSGGGGTYDVLHSPNIDSLFDKCLISFSDDGQMISSSKLSDEELKRLGIPEGVTIKVTEGMKKYLKKHRERLLQ